MPGYLDEMATASETRLRSATSCPQLLVRRIESLPDAERAFVHLYGASPNAFWLDSSATGERGRFSFIGDSEGPLGAVVTYDVNAQQVSIEKNGETEVREESIFDYLDRGQRALDPAMADLPFGFQCGFAGYLGYELKADCDAAAAHQAPTPDAAFVFADRLIAFDHEERCTYLVAMAPIEADAHQVFYEIAGKLDAGGVVGGAERWIEETSRRLAALPSLPEPAPQRPVDLRLRRSRKRYLDDIAACKRYLTAGHSYEICLTDKVVAEADPDPLALYRALRRTNPAPFAAYLRFGDLAVLSSSPERFLAVDRHGWAESRPIKGTSRRGETPEEDARLASALRADEKSRAENVTIVDLVRNDLGRVCETGTVGVPELMRVETYETVHQLVSSVRGRLRAEIGPAGCARACFPPGSMTGAPKLRTMEIIDELEGEARGVYSGAIGYLGLGGTCDLSVAIRGIVIEDGSLGIGAGGAIVAESDPGDELAEMLLKARAPAAALSGTGSAPPVAEPTAGQFSLAKDLSL